ncbi:MAG: ABC transporter ATP-binding protein [Actinobacteria bacterium]|nr:ABC transporter ATP-binding protein [Actinomycetota bacterium]
MSSENELLIENTYKNFGNVSAVKNFNLKVEDNEFVTLLGPSGCGKTTLLRIIAGFEIPDSGDVLLNGKSIVNIPPYKRPLNMVFQRYALFPHMTVYENIAFSQFLKKKPKEEIKNKVKKMLELVQLEGFEKRKPDQLSGGQCQRVALVRALINEPKVLLLDEPLGALDLKIRKDMQIEIKNIQERLKMTFIYVTHDQEEAMVMSDRIVLMRNGEIIQIGKPKEIYNYPNSIFSAKFIGENNILDGEVLEIKNDHLVIDINGLNILTNKTSNVKIRDKVFLAIRPEKIKRIYTIENKSFDNHIVGKIEKIVFFGSTIKYYVSISEEIFLVIEEKVAEENNKHVKGNNIGDEVNLRFSKEDVDIFLK